MLRLFYLVLTVFDAFFAILHRNEAASKGVIFQEHSPTGFQKHSPRYSQMH